MNRLLKTFITLMIIACSAPSPQEDYKADSSLASTINIKDELPRLDNSKDTTIVDKEKKMTESSQASKEDSISDLPDNETHYKLTDIIVADFNGDGHLDKAVFKQENKTSGIIITHGQTDEIVKIGFEEPFSHLTNFNWVEEWGLSEEKNQYEVLVIDGEIAGQRDIKLINPSIFVRLDGLGGLITFMDEKYTWIHQAH